MHLCSNMVFVMDELTDIEVQQQNTAHIKEVVRPDQSPSRCHVGDKRLSLESVLLTPYRDSRKAEYSVRPVSRDQSPTRGYRHGVLLRTLTHVDRA